jgi:hypothetical protein
MIIGDSIFILDGLRMAVSALRERVDPWRDQEDTEEIISYLLECVELIEKQLEVEIDGENCSV